MGRQPVARDEVSAGATRARINREADETLKRRKRILVVDNEASVLLVLREALQSFDDRWDVITAADGSHAWRQIKEQPCDLIVTDLRMPGLDGIELTEAIRAFHPSTAVVWITAYGCHEVSQVRRRLGVYRCLNKPLVISEIRRAVQDGLDARERLLHPYATGGNVDGTEDQENRHTGRG
jgi:CheY-like chemotaxis protein